MKRIARALGAAWLAASALLLAGCATGYLLDNQVQSFSSLPALPAAPTYRFERLPSQQNPQQAQLEALADGPLFRAGLRRDDSNPRYAVQVSARVQRVLSPYADPWDWGGWGWGWGIGAHHRGIGIGIGGPFGRMDQPWFQREVSVIVREIAGNRVVFESRANNDGPGIDNNSVLPAMFDAALNGFPNPPPGPRRVDIHLGAK